MSKIKNLSSRIVKNSRGDDTIEVTVLTTSHSGSFSVPSGASTGSKEVIDLPVEVALKHIEDIEDKIVGMSVTAQTDIDQRLHELDGHTDNFSSLGGNVALGISAAAAVAAAAEQEIPLWQYFRKAGAAIGNTSAPRLVVNLVNGGKHAKRGSPIQEHQIIPDTTNVAEALEMAIKVQTSLRQLAEKRFDIEEIGIGDEGGLELPTTSIQEPFQLIQSAIAISDVSKPITMGTDVAASSFYSEEGYCLSDSILDTESLVGVYKDLSEICPLLRWFEDPFAESDWEGFVDFGNANIADLTIGDDLTVTDVALLEKAIQQQAVNALIIKPNQIGTISDTLNTIDYAHRHNIRCIVSHRSGETEDTLITDLAYGLQCYGLKAGAPNAPFRQEKYNRLVQIAS